MKAVVIIMLGMAFSISAYAKESGFYVNGVSAKTAKGAQLLVEDLVANEGDHNVCYEGDYESALENVHSSISIAINDVYGENEYPSLDVEVLSSKGNSVASGIIPACD